MYIHVPVQPPVPPSPKAIELAAKIAELVRILRREDPSISRAEVEQGISLAKAELRRELGGRSAGPQLMLVLGLSVMLGVGVVVYFLKGGMGGEASMLWVIIGLITGLAVVALLLALFKSKR